LPAIWALKSSLFYLRLLVRENVLESTVLLPRGSTVFCKCVVLSVWELTIIPGISSEGRKEAERKCERQREQGERGDEGREVTRGQGDGWCAGRAGSWGPWHFAYSGAQHCHNTQGRAPDSHLPEAAEARGVKTLGWESEAQWLQNPRALLAMAPRAPTMLIGG
jgi:hypothetical protein